MSEICGAFLFIMAIQPKDLRIGNKVYYGEPNRTLVAVKNITDTGINRVDEYDEDDDGNPIPYGHEYVFEHLEPIPLSSEILEKCGFAYNNKRCEYSIGYFKIIQWGEDGYILSFYEPIDLDEHPKCKQFPYLHQLQNLYYDLTGKELNVQL